MAALKHAMGDKGSLRCDEDDLCVSVWMISALSRRDELRVLKISLHFQEKGKLCVLFERNFFLFFKGRISAFSSTLWMQKGIMGPLQSEWSFVFCAEEECHLNGGITYAWEGGNLYLGSNYRSGKSHTVLSFKPGEIPLCCLDTPA